MDSIIETGEWVVFLSQLTLTLDGTAYTVEVKGTRVNVNGHDYTVSEKDGQIMVDGILYAVKFEKDVVMIDGISHSYSIGTASHKPTEKSKVEKKGKGIITAIMPGKIVTVRVKKGDTVEKGDILCILEAMKMENEIRAPISGKITSITIDIGSKVEKDEVLMEIA